MGAAVMCRRVEARVQRSFLRMEETSQWPSGVCHGPRVSEQEELLGAGSVDRRILRE
jgi:hypothetical protein